MILCIGTLSEARRAWRLEDEQPEQCMHHQMEVSQIHLGVLPFRQLDKTAGPVRKTS